MKKLEQLLDGSIVRDNTVEQSDYNLKLGDRSVFEKYVWNAAIEAAASKIDIQTYGEVLPTEIRKLKK